MKPTRVARAGAHIIVTDFHPAAARAGHTRSFRDAQGRLHTVEHFIHDLGAHRTAAAAAQLTLDSCLEPAVGPQVRSVYEQAGRLGTLAAAEIIQHLGARPQTSLKALAQKHGLPV